MYDVAIIGSGPGGYVAALRAALQGAKTCIIEKEHIGGTCLNVGCIPTKTMLHAGETAWHIRHAKELGLSAGELTVDDKAFMKRTARVVSTLRAGVNGLLKKRQVDIIKGFGRLSNPNTITVDTDGKQTTVQARSIIIATGSQPVRPGFLPWENPCLMTTDEATSATTLPKDIIILGGGVIGCEFATVYSELGIPTTLVEMLDSVVANMDDDIIKAITASLKKRGVNLHTGTKLESVKPDNQGVVAQLSNGEQIKASAMLVAIGRKPNTDDIGLNTVGITTDKGLIPVNARCQTSIPTIYAIGDAAVPLQYAHVASRMGIIAADNATGHPSEDKLNVVPTGIYTHPEVASVGLSEKQAKEIGEPIRIASFPYMASGMAKAYGETEGMVKLIASEKHGEILGAVIIGPHATDTIQEVALAMKNELTIEEIAHTIHPHPTFIEAIGEAAEAWLGMPLHSL